MNDPQDGHLYLTGYRGCGKSTVAKILAEQLGRYMIDLDDVIEQKAGRSIREIFADESEIGFRDRETAALLEVAGQKPAIVALGGGTILRAENRQVIASTGRCVWLDGSPELLASRIAHDAASASRRPSLTDRSVVDEVQEVLMKRLPLYQQAADWRVELTNQPAAEVAKLICTWWKD